MNDARPIGKDAEKYRVIDELLVQEYTLIHVNTMMQGVVLPQHLLSQPTVTLKISRFFPKPMFLGKETVRAELMFNGGYFSCIVPWEAIWGVTSLKGEGKVWIEAVPKGVFQELAKVMPQARAKSSSPEEKPKPKTEEPAAKKKKDPSAREHLRRIK